MTTGSILFMMLVSSFRLLFSTVMVSLNFCLHDMKRGLYYGSDYSSVLIHTLVQFLVPKKLEDIGKDLCPPSQNKEMDNKVWVNSRAILLTIFTY